MVLKNPLSLLSVCLRCAPPEILLLLLVTVRSESALPSAAQLCSARAAECLYYSGQNDFTFKVQPCREARATSQHGGTPGEYQKHLLPDLLCWSSR
ncbi:hypothetical protein PBY51_013746 [Eleginops maclovinus]|uniref:Uncharacterized protein n=1 Tax=Eleginops maclovinus TaxID=56733 RepID=A0AAN8AXX5_ELEMC|nr:hypothetical protein PBY51_013746 [Eleginops maclovinus]